MLNAPKKTQADSIEDLQRQRLVQIFWAVEFAIILCGTVFILRGSTAETLILIVTGLSLVSSYGLAMRGKIGLGANVLLCILTLMACTLVWINNGLRDEAILVFPGILIFSLYIGRRSIFFFLLSIMVSEILIIGVLSFTGHYDASTEPASFFTAVVITIVLTCIAFGSYLTSNDLRKALKRLEEENQRVRKSQGEISHLVHHDALTNLPNRILAKDRFTQAVALSQRNKMSIGLMFIDLDNFKTINDSLGHQSGDHLLKELSFRLSRIVRVSDTVCRLGGDEFLVIIHNITDIDYVSKVARKMLASIEEPVKIQGELISTTCSIGIAMSPDDSSDFETLFMCADLAMYHSKDAGRNNFSFYNEQMNINAKQHLSLISDMRKGIPNNEFVLYFQPKIDLKTNTVMGAEALVRWQHPEKGLIFPDEFIHLAERSGLIVDLGEWVIQEACRTCRQWHLMGHQQLSIGVNVSSIQFKRGNIKQVIEESLGSNNLQPNLLEIELTESTLMDLSPSVAESMNEIHKLGIQFSIDDFGTGYSNLGYLKLFNVETLKIDRSFIQDILNDKGDETIVNAIIQIASSMKIQTVAEGIEDLATVNKVRALNCDIGQGYFWSRPLPADEFINYVDAIAKGSCTLPETS
mgnify:CR=1 FL=1